MNTAFSKLGLGLIFAAVLIYFLMVINFQSWTDPFIIITALAGAFAGILWMLFLTHTTFNVESMMGAILSVGVASYSILMMTFANEQREGKPAIDAAVAAGHTRLRPVVMTALAMILGMVPIALGRGEGGGQNAPLGRAVIGGLLLAIVATLFFVPVVFSMIRHKTRSRDMDDDLDLLNTQPDRSPNFKKNGMTTTQHMESFKANLQSSAQSFRRLNVRAVLGTVVVLARLFLVGMFPRWPANAALTSAARDQRPTVSVVARQRPDGAANLVLSGSTQAIA
jgi:AcrB/AcrD/AcrF family protein